MNNELDTNQEIKTPPVEEIGDDEQETTVVQDIRKAIVIGTKYFFKYLFLFLKEVFTFVFKVYRALMGSILALQICGVIMFLTFCISYLYEIFTK